MRVKYENIKASALVCGVEYATSDAKIAESTMQVSDRMSKFKLFTFLEGMQEKYGIEETDIDSLLLLIKRDAEQGHLESFIE